MTTTPPNTGKALRVALATQNMKRKELAKKVGMTESYISRLATGRASIQGATLNKIADALGMKVSEFLALGEQSE